MQLSTYTYIQPTATGFGLVVITDHGRVETVRSTKQTSEQKHISVLA